MAVLVTLLFWSSAFAGIRAGLDGGYGPGEVVLLRFLTASVVFALYALSGRLRLPARRDLPVIVGLALVGITVYHIALTFGEQTVEPGTASLIVASAPIFTSLLALAALRERLTGTGWLGMALGFLGVAIIALAGGRAPGFTRGALLLLVCALATAIFFVYQKPLFARYKAIDLTAYFTWIGVIPMLVFLPGLIREAPHATVSATLACVYIGIFPAAIAYALWAYALSKGRATTVSSTLYINPILAIFIAWIWLGETPTGTALIGGTISLCGVLLVAWRGRRLRPV